MGCGMSKSSVTAQTDKASSKSGQLPKADQLQSESLFIEASKEKLLNNDQEAAQLFAECLKLDKNNDAAMYELAMLYVKFGQWNEAGNLVKKAINIDENNRWYKELHVKVLQHNKEYKEAIKQLTELVETYPEEFNYYFDLSNLYIINNKYEEAIEVLDQLENSTGINKQLSSQKSKLYKAIGKPEKAIEEIQKLVDSEPETNNYLLLAAEYEKNGRPDEAFRVYKDILKEDPMNGHAHLALADYYKRKGEIEKYNEEIKYVFENPEFDIRWKIKTLQEYLFEMESKPELREEALELCGLLVKAHPKDAKSYAVHGDFLRESKKYEEAAGQYRQSLKLDDSDYRVWESLFHMNTMQEDFGSVVEDTEEALEIFPNQPTVYYFRGIALLRQKKYEEAVGVLKQGTGLYVTNKPLLAEMYANLGEAYFELKKYEEMDKAYETSIKNDEGNPYTLNNYSYYLSLRGDKLEEAKKMAEKANKLEPNVASFEDTYAWVLYKLGNFEEAKKWIEKAISHDKPSAEIFEHYGDILFKLGSVKEAVEYWKKAKESGSESEFIDKKIEEEQLFE